MQATLDGTDSLNLEEIEEKENSSIAYEMDEELCTEKGGLWTNASDKGEEAFYCDYKQNFESESDEKLANIEAVKAAISFCIDSEDCDADSEELAMIIVHMEQRETHEKDCNNSKHCNRDKDQRLSLIHI